MDLISLACIGKGGKIVGSSGYDDAEAIFW